MVTTVKKATAFNPVQTFREHMSLKKDAAKIQTRSESLKKRLKEWLPEAEDAYKNEQGSIFYDLPDTVEVGGETFKGMELRRAVSSLFDEDAAEKILRRKGVYEQALTPVLDQDKVLRLVQEGAITEAEFDKMLTQKESFAFWPVKGEVV